jgi:hypothetical protein
MADPSNPEQVEPIVGAAETDHDKAIVTASVDLLTKREDRGREAATTLIGQIATVGSFLVAFGLLNDEAKEAVLKSPWPLVALGAAAVSLGCSLATLVFLPSKMPSLSRPVQLTAYWNSRVVWRWRWLAAALFALGVAIVAAVASFAEGGNALAPKAAAVLVTKFTPAKDTASTLEATATYTGIESGRALLLCLSDPTGAFVAGGEGTADDTVDSQTITVTAPIAADATETIAMTAYSAARPKSNVADSCKAAPQGFTRLADAALTNS